MQMGCNCTHSEPLGCQSRSLHLLQIRFQLAVRKKQLSAKLSFRFSLFAQNLAPDVECEAPEQKREVLPSRCLHCANSQRVSGLSLHNKGLLVCS